MSIHSTVGPSLGWTWGTIPSPMSAYFGAFRLDALTGHRQTIHDVDCVMPDTQ